MDFLVAPRWSPYFVGAGIGVLSWLTFVLSDKPLGCSTAFARTSGMLERVFRGDRVDRKEYYVRFPPRIDWEWMLVVGVFLGAFLSASLSGTLRIEWTPSRWVTAFGPGFFARWVVALVGGFLMGFGARWAGGCTSGHGISGTLQMAVSGWLAAICFFAGGIAVAMLIFRVAAG
ncbi:MAG: YeeE/YedE family protein [Candidatus Eisenbacteria bacterium]|nr:YeeE/YedE family protein [Candidatus Eisenbacteria bacterium]